MSFLLDTNALSEVTRPRPDKSFMTWLGALDEGQVFIRILTVGEIRRGIWRLPEGRRRRELEAANEQLITDYADRILGVDDIVAMEWPRLSSQLSLAGVVIGAVDELLVATALFHDLTMVTRNTRHFRDAGCRLLCPWTGGDDD